MKLIYFEKSFNVEVKNTIRGSELKEILREKLNHPKGAIRLFCVGQEINDNKTLSAYALSNDFVVISKIMK